MADVDTLLLGRIIYQLGSCSSFFQFWTVFWLLVCISERVFGKGGTNVASRPGFGMFADRGARLSLLGARLSLLRPRPRPRQPPLRSGAPLDPSSRRPHTGLNGSSGPAPPSCFPSPRSFAFTFAAGAPAPARPAMNLVSAGPGAGRASPAAGGDGERPQPRSPRGRAGSSHGRPPPVRDGGPAERRACGEQAVRWNSLLVSPKDFCHGAGRAAGRCGGCEVWAGRVPRRCRVLPHVWCR